ncbi:NAD(P)/FAD-dependent oxidoreductase [Rhodococcus rhodochrous]|uniref:Ferredoxin--NADP reductase n=1 Tax=Rhodococcus rhodochrous TaxID=1829 RepID=A0AAW4XE48_RHORH|nr:NAD(P)/FAD-dependent oxidoreductase [Rhodococcus rhodochrous]MCD2111322.1 NAD(P)/FAD-dependent oxidoreductase [Rhodococcus rhodochrous]QHG81309.1 NAD(P)/FAD-dependent oxidoreductase [Rhodococcus rhodochrous]QOH54691.1 ferredoxin--NADP(+) reductase [Rhodococcus rhodochrous]
MTDPAHTVGATANTTVTDLLVVGAGPAGLYATYYAGFRGMSVALVDSLPEVGGQVAAMYPEKPIYDIAGFPSVKGRELVERLRAQAMSAEPVLLLGHTATTLEHVDDGIVVTTDLGHRIEAKALLLTGGVGSFIPRELPVGSDYLGRGLRYFVPRPDDLAGEDVVVVGGGDSAIDWALSLEPVAASVTLVHRRPVFRAHERSVATLQKSSVRILTPHEVVAIGGEERIDSVTVRERGADPITLSAGSVVAALGFIADLGPLDTWGLAQERRRILVDRHQQTSLPRVYSAGDISEYPGKVRLMSVGFGEAAAAVNNIAPLIDSSLSTTPGHSSDR